MASEGVGFSDVTTGNNDIDNVGGYSAGVGYDMASGLGSPDGTPFIAGLCAPKIDAAKSTFTSPSANVATRQSRQRECDPGRIQRQLPSPTPSSAVSASAASGTIEINGSASSATGPGQASTTVTSSSSGTANFTLTSSVGGSGDGDDLLRGHHAAHGNDYLPAPPSPAPCRVDRRLSSLVATVGGFKLVVAPDSAGSSPITFFQYSLNGCRRGRTSRRRRAA